MSVPFIGKFQFLNGILDQFVDCKFYKTSLYIIYSSQIGPKLCLKVDIKKKKIFFYHIFMVYHDAPNMPSKMPPHTTDLENHTT